MSHPAKCFLAGLIFALSAVPLTAQIPLSAPDNAAPAEAGIGEPSPASMPADKPKDPPANPAAERAQEKKEEVEEKLRVAKRELQNAEEQGDAKKKEQLTQVVDLKQQQTLALGQQTAAANHKAELERIRDDLSAQLQSLREGEGALEPPTFLELDRIRDELDAQQAAEISYDAGAKAAENSLVRAKDAVQEKERARQRAKEALDKNTDPAAAEKLQAALKVAQEELVLASETVKLRVIELEAERVQTKIHRLRLTLLKEQVEKYSGQVAFEKSDLDTRFDEIKEREERLRVRVSNLDVDLAYAERQYNERRAKVDASLDPAELLKEEVETWRLWRKVSQEELKILNQRLERLARLRQAHERRYKLANFDPPARDVAKWQTETSDFLDQLAAEKRLQNIRYDQLRQELAANDARQQAAKDKPAVQPEIGKQRMQLERLATVYDENYVSIDTAQRVNERLAEEIGGDIEELTFSERAALIWQQVAGVWNYPLTSIDDSPITPGKILGALLLLFIGYLASRFLSNLLGRRILPRSGMHASAAVAIQTITFYTLIAVFTLFALQAVSIPLTLFTFLGGAIAIGVGFGSQNILNNFISGLILLAERPVRHGDLIQIDSLYGTVEKIGARSTRVRTATNLEIIIPNSKFLENNVVNWTLSDDKIRAEVKIGVAYGSPTRDVARLLKRAADEHGLILANPEPFVWFTDFSDNSLQFELHFWIEMRTLAEKRRIESDIRHRIDTMFREAGVVIAFPQRDVHLDVARPLQVQVLPAEAVEQERRREAA